jgi:hypothetical protein
VLPVPALPALPVLPVLPALPALPALPEYNSQLCAWIPGKSAHIDLRQRESDRSGEGIRDAHLRL